MEQPIVDPPTPYLGTITDGFTQGKMVRIQGYVSPVGERITINFQTGANVKPRDDVGLHLSIRFLQGYIARNSYQSGMWGDEEGDGDLPIEPGQKFEIIVLSFTSKYKIAVNGKHFCEFLQRIPASSITHLSIEGDVSLSLISYENDVPGGAPDVSASAPPQSHATYGPPPSGDAYGPGGFGSYGPPQQGQYQPPAPPGYPQEKESELGSFLETAGTVLAGAIRSGAAEKLLGSLSGGGGANQQQQHAPQPPPQQNYNAPQSQDTLGGLGSLLSSFTGQNNQSQHQPQQQGGGNQDMLSGLGSLLSSFTGNQNQAAPPPPPPQQQPNYGAPPPSLQPQSGGQDALAGLGSLLSSFGGQSQAPQQRPPPGAASQGQDVLGGLSSLLSTLSTHNQQPQQSQQSAPVFDPSNATGHGSVGGLGSVGNILGSLAGQIITNPQQDEKR